ncbi:MAG: outer membrane protein assembly factor BamA [Caulobacteraceae bacterium]|nr:outer membrane protein assembly factor BamA [Caulobacteraceae bacterium]
MKNRPPVYEDAMTHPRARSAAIVSSLALALGMSLAAPVTAAAQATADSGQVVTSIVVTGNERIPAETVKQYLPIHQGDRVGEAELSAAVQALTRADLGLFNSAATSATIVDGVLTVKVEENPIINSVTFEGNKAISTDKLRQEITVRPRATFTSAKVQADVSRITELYRQKGRITATVTPKIVELSQKRVDLIFEIVEGGKTGVEDVNFLGNTQFSDNDLKDVVVTKKSTLLTFFNPNTNYDPDRIDYDREQLRAFYRNRGYYDFKVVSAVAELNASTSDFDVTYTLDEGQRFRFGKVSVQTELQKLNGAVLQPLVPIKSGEIYSDGKISQAVDALTFAAGSAGFAFVDVRPRYVANRDNHTIDVVFDVQEGPRVYINHIDIVGNSRTRDDVIRRSLEVAEGDAYNQVLIDRSTTNLRALQFFKDVTIEREDTDDANPDRTNLKVSVTEQPTGQLSVSAGYSSYEKITIDLGVSESNFRGRGQQVSVNVSTGEIQKQITASFTEPHFLGRNLSAGVNAYTYRYNDTQQVDFTTASTGGGFTLGFPLTAYASFQGRYTLKKDTVSVDDAGCASGALSVVLCLQRGSALDSMVGYTIKLDRRNDQVRPTAGFYVQLGQDLAGVGGDVNYLKTEGEGGYYYDLTHGFVFGMTGEFGYIDGWNGDRVRINDRYFRGGGNFRGFDTAGIGPRDNSAAGGGSSLGAKLYAQGTLEMTVPTLLPDKWGISASLFTDFGTAGMLDDQDKQSLPGLANPDIHDNLGLRAAAGISVTWKSPIGPVRFDFSHVLRKEPFDRTKVFQFTQVKRF